MDRYFMHRVVPQLRTMTTNERQLTLFWILSNDSGCREQLALAMQDQDHFLARRQQPPPAPPPNRAESSSDSEPEQMEQQENVREGPRDQGQREPRRGLEPEPERQADEGLEHPPR